MPDIQQMTDVEQAKARLEGVVESSPVQGQNQSLIRPNPQKPAEAGEKHIRPVKSKPKKKKFGEKLKEAFFGDIGDGSITEHIFFNIFVPSFKRVLSDMGNTAINMALGLDPKSRTIRSGNTHVSNASLYRDRNFSRNMNGQSGYPRREAVCDYTWDEETAKDIYNQINDVMEQVGYVTLADVYSIMNMGNRIRSTDKNWGWISMRNAEVYPIDANGEEWIVSLPPAKPLQYQ